MKNLKKILIVIAVLALLASSIAVVISAEGDASVAGDVSKLQSLLGEIQADMDKAESGKESPDVTKQAQRLAELYALLGDEKYEWNENDSAFKEAVAKAAEYTVTIGNSIYDEYTLKLSASTPDYKKIEAEVRALYDHLNASGAPADTVGLAELYVKYDEANKALLETYLQNSKDATKSADKIAAMTKLFAQLYYAPLNENVEADRALIKKYSGEGYTLAKDVMQEFKNSPEYNEVAYKTETVNGQAVQKVDEAKTNANFSNRVSFILVIQEFVEYIDLGPYVNMIDSSDVTVAEGSTPEQAINDERIKRSGEVRALESDVADAIEARKTIIAENEAKLDAEANFDSYDLSDIVSKKNYDGTKTEEDIKKLSADERKKYNDENSLMDGVNAAGQWKTTKASETVNGVYNGYQAFIYGSNLSGDSRPHLYSHYTFGKKADEHGVVIEFDLRIHDTFKQISFTELDTSVQGAAKFETIFVITNKGEIAYTQSYPDPVTGKKEYIKAENVLVLDAWHHFTITYDNEKRVGKLYVDYKFVMDLDYLQEEDGNYNDFRFGPSREDNWQWDLDNFHIYQGTQYRNTTKFSSMQEPERFKFFAEYAMDEEAGYPYLSRSLAYKKAQAIVSKAQQKYPDLVAAFNSYNYDDKIKGKAVEENLELLRISVVELDDITMNSEQIEKIKKKIASIEDFVANNGELMNKGDTRDDDDVIDSETGKPILYSGKGYQALMTVVYSIEADLKKVQQTSEFAKAISYFERAQTTAALSKYKALADEIYAAAGYEIESNRELAKEDPLVVEFELKINNIGIDSSSPDYIAVGSEAWANRITIFDYYDTLDEILDSRDEYENAKRIVNGIAYITSLEGYENTDEFLLANREQIEVYVSIIRDIVTANAYDVTYPGVVDAVALYAEIDIFYYELLQQEYIVFLTDLIAGYAETQSYVERRSIINAALVYFDPIDNPKDLAIYRAHMSEALRTRVEDELAALTELEVAVEVYNRELDGFRESFEDVLDQQTQYFINIIAHMDTLDTVADLKALFAEAEGYYYGINVDAEGATYAAERFAYYRDYLASVERDNAYFILYADNFMNAIAYKGTEKRDLLFNTINECSIYVDNIDKADRTVKGYYDMYVEAIEEYVAHVLAVNSAIYDSAQFVNAMRSEQVSATVLAIIAGIINA